MNVAELRRLVSESFESNEIPLMVTATAGTTVLGAFDSISDIAEVCRQFNLWLHVDVSRAPCDTGEEYTLVNFPFKGFVGRRSTAVEQAQALAERD